MKNNQNTLLNSFPNLDFIFTNRLHGNLAFHVGDDEQNVLTNHESLSKHLNYSKNNLIHMQQIHSDIVHVITDNDSFNNPPTCDALITDKADIPLMVMVADCTPVLFFNVNKNIIAVAHAGRAGAFKNIIKKVLDTFTKDFHSNIDNIYVQTGASICKNCYEVGYEIYNEACKLSLSYAVEKKDSSYYLDIKRILKKQLLEYGILEDHIDISSECSCCKNDKYFSYRANNKTGRFAGVIKLKS
jgi:YfiH family protein